MASIRPLRTTTTPLDRVGPLTVTILALRMAMTGGGFLQLSHEWWHYNALPEDEIRARYPIIEKA